MFVCFLFALISCSIPDQFSILVKKVIANSHVKIPKKDRETTKYQGNYSFQNAHFTLLKNLTSLRATDIKAFAIEKNYAAIMKKKKFAIDDGFVFLDYETQQFYLMKETVAFDDRINIYKVQPIEMFQVFSDLEIKGRSPLLTYDVNCNWDSYTDRPKFTYLGNLSAGAGAYFSALIQTRVHFMSIKKAEIATDVTLNGKVGTGLKITKTELSRYQNISIVNDISHKVPGLITEFNFMGLKFNFEVFLTFDAILRNLETELQADIDYYKIFQFTAKRYMSIKCHGISDSGWQTVFSPIPTNNLIDGNTSNVEANKLSALIEINQGIIMKATVASNIQFDLRFGLLEPFKFDFDYKPLICPFPYLYGNSELPLSSYFHFSGIEANISLFQKVINYKLLNEIHKDTYLLQYFKTRKHCLFDSRNNGDRTIIDYDGFDDDQSSNETSLMAIVLEVNNVEKRYSSNSLLSFQTSLVETNPSTNAQLQLFNRRASIYENNKIKSFDQIIIADEINPLTSKVLFNFYYYVGTNQVEKSNEQSYFLKDYLEKNGEYTKVTLNNPADTETISFDFRINYCEILPYNEMYIPSLRNGIINNDFQIGDEICVIVKDVGSNIPDYIDENAIFTTDGSLSRNLTDKGIFVYNDEYFQFHLDKIILPNKPILDSYVNYEIRAEWGNNYEEKVLLVSNFTNSFTQGTNTIFDDNKPKIKITKDMRLWIFISYIYNYNVISMNQPITYSEIISAINSNKQTIVKTQSNSKISCSITFERYKPIILLNCTKKSSVHRIITNIYSLDSYQPSDFKPQIVKFRDNLAYGVLKIRRIHKNIKWMIIHMPFLQPLCSFTMISDEYYQIPIDTEIVYIPFRKENISMNEVTINHIIQGNFVDDETVYFENKYYSVNFDETPVVLAFVRTIENQYSIAGIENTKQTLIDYGNDIFKILILSYGTDKDINIASSLVIIDENTPFIEKKIPDFPQFNIVAYHVWCQRASAIMIHDITTHQTTENNIIKDGIFFKVMVKPDHIVDFIPVCKNLSQSMCYIKQNFADKNGYAVFKYPNKNGISILDTQRDNLFEQEDRQGLIEEIIQKDKEFYYMTTFNQPIQIIRTYTNKTNLELRIIDVKDEYIKFCVVDRDAHFVPISRSYYTDHFNSFIDEFEIQNNVRFYDFSSGDSDSCIYAKYMAINEDGSSNSSSRKNILSNPIKSLPNPSTQICDLANSFKVLYYHDIRQLVPPVGFEPVIYSVKKAFEDYWANDVIRLQSEIDEYFIRAKKLIIPEYNNSIFVLYLPYDEISYINTLNENEYISADKGITIHFIGGILNYILPDKFHTIIDIGGNEEIKLNLYGKGSLEFQSTNQSKIKINGQINVDSIKTIRVNNNVKLVEIESVNFANYSELHIINKANEKVELKISNIMLLEHSRVNLTNIEILKKMVIRQTATAFVDSTVKFSESELFIELKVYQNDLIPMISGILPDPPKKIHILRSVENQGPKLEEEYMFFDGEFDCQLWLDKLDFGNSYFNTARCSQMNNTESNLQSFEAIGAFLSFMSMVIPLIEKMETAYFIAGTVFFVLSALCVIAIIVMCILCHGKLLVGNDEDYL